MSIRPDCLLTLAALTAAVFCPPGAHAQVPAGTPRSGITPLPRVGVLATPPATPYVRPATEAAPFVRSAVPTPPQPRPLLPQVTPVAVLSSPPAREIPLVEKKLEDLSNNNVSKDGQIALAIDPAKWKHAETDNFIIHYRRATEAQKVVREIEYDLWYVATTLKATRERYAKKSHVYVFEDQKEWQSFLNQSNNQMKWAVSFAFRDELFLNVRGAGNSGTGSFDSHTLAHETTHAVVARIFPRKRWPLWLSEGFAEYMGGASVAARKGQSSRHFERDLNRADLPLEKLAEITSYPESQSEIHQLYQTSEKFVRFLMSEMPRDRIVSFIDAVLGGQSLNDAVLSTYSDKVKDWADFQKKYAKFTK